MTEMNKAPPAPYSRSAFAPFRNGVFLAVWSGTLASNLGIWIQLVGASWLMTGLTSDAELVALVQSATAAPVLLWSLPAGALADLWDRRLVLLLGQCILLGGAVLLWLVQDANAMTPWLLLLLIFFLHTGSALRQPAYQAAVGELVPPEDLPAAVALNSLAVNVARATGPALGGMLVAMSSVEAAFIAAAMCNLPMMIVLIRWRPARHILTRPPQSFGWAVIDGVRYVLGVRPVLTVMARSFVFTLFASALWALLPLVAREHFEGGAVGYGFLLGCLGLGAILGAVCLAGLRRNIGGEMLVGIGTIAFALPTFVVITIPSLTAAAVLLFLGGAAWMITLSSLNIMIQLSAANWVRARALSIYFISLFSGFAIGSWVWGTVAELIGVPLALMMAGTGLLLSVILAPLLRLPPTHPGS